MKTLLFFIVFLFLFFSGFSQDNNTDSKIEIEKLQTAIKTLQYRNSIQKAEINKLEELLTNSQIKQDSAFGLIDNTNSKATKSLLSLEEVNNQLNDINKNAQNRAMRIHQGKINLFIILSVMSFGILVLSVFLYFRQTKFMKITKEYISRYEDNISIMFDKIKSENETNIENLHSSLNLRMAELHKTELTKIDELRAQFKKEIEFLNNKVNEKLLYLDNNHEMLSDKIIESQKFNIIELEKTKESFDSLVISNNSIIDARLKKSESILKKQLDEMKKSTEVLCKKMVADNKNVLRTVEIFKKKRGNIKENLSN